MACLGHELYELGWPGGIGRMRHTTLHERSPMGDEGMPAWWLRETLDIIGDRVYLLYANLCDLTRQTARVSSSDRTNTRRVCACAAGLCCGLCCTLSVR